MAGRASPPARLLRGSLWTLVAGALFSLMGVTVKLGASGSQPLSSGELVFYRSLFGFLGILPGVLWRRPRLLTPNWRWHLSRSLIGTAGTCSCCPCCCC